MNKDKIRIYCLTATFLVWGLLLLTSPCMAAGPGDAQELHPELSEQEQYIDCADCHREATASIYQQWHDSVHGVAMIKCYLCHGTFESFVVSPPKDNCATCHADMLEKEPGKRCHECHIPHTFKVDE